MDSGLCRIPVIHGRVRLNTKSGSARSFSISRRDGRNIQQNHPHRLGVSQPFRLPCAHLILAGVRARNFEINTTPAAVLPKKQGGCFPALGCVLFHLAWRVSDAAPSRVSRDFIDLVPAGRSPSFLRERSRFRGAILNHGDMAENGIGVVDAFLVQPQCRIRGVPSSSAAQVRRHRKPRQSPNPVPVPFGHRLFFIIVVVVTGYPSSWIEADN